MGIYQQLRTLPDNLDSWKTNLIEPLLAENVQIDIYISLSNATKADSLLLRRALEATDLYKHVVAYKEVPLLDEHPLVSQAMRLVAAQGNNCVILNPPEPLFWQYVARHEITRSIHERILHMRGLLTYDYIILLRSDFSLGSSLQHNYTLRDGNHSRAMDFLTANTSRRLAWIPAMNNFGGYNDRFLLLSGAAFDVYQRVLLKRLLAYLASPLCRVHGEDIHQYMLEAAAENITSLWICYGVRRAVGCSWMHYGIDPCDQMRLPRVNESFTSPLDPALRICPP